VVVAFESSLAQDTLVDLYKTFIRVVGLPELGHCGAHLGSKESTMGNHSLLVSCDPAYRAGEQGHSGSQEADLVILGEYGAVSEVLPHVDRCCLGC
jgi:hypothetical protein